MSWKTVALGDVCDITGGGTPSKSNPKFYIGDIPWATVRDMNRDYLEETEFKISKEAVKESSTNIIPKNNVVISTRVGLGKVCIIKQDTAINQDLRGVVPKNPKVLDVNYLFFWFKSISKVIVDAGRGATVHGVTLPFIKSLQIPLPALSTQQKIVSKLDAIFAEIDKATAAAEANAKNAEALFQSYLTEIFERGGDGWGKVKLSDVVREIVTGPFGSALHKSDYVDYGVPVINPQNLVNGKINPLAKTMVSESTKSRLKKYSLKQKDIVIARRGEMGRCGLVDAETEGWLCGTGSMIIRLNDRANENYIFQLLQSNRVRRELESASIGATMSNLNQSILLDVQFSLPPIDFQLKTIDAINNLSEKTYSLSRYYIEKIKEHSQLKQSILKQAFNGELVKE